MPESTQLIQRVERARRVVSLCSQAIIRAYDEEALLAEECRMLIDVGDYSLVWVGVADAGNLALTTLAHAGTVASGVRGARAPWEENGGIYRFTLRAVREQRPQVLRNLPAHYPEAATLEYGAVCAFPLQFGPYGNGAITLYAREPDAFAPEEVALLRELASDMGFGVAGLRAKEANDQLSEQLEAAERRLRDLIDQAPVPIVQMRLDGKILVTNQALADLLGYASPEEILAQPPAELARHVAPGDIDRILQFIRADHQEKPLELRIRRCDDSEAWVEVTVQHGPKLREEDVVVAAFVRDLTAERSERMASSRLAAIVDASEEAVIGVDLHGIVRNWSLGATALYGYSQSEMVGRDLGEVCVPPDRRVEWENVLARLAAGRRLRRFETRRLGKNREIKEVSVTASPVFYPDDKVVGISLMEHDVRERKRVQQIQLAHERQHQEVLRLQELSRMQAEFMNRASHELNTPLTPLLLQVQALHKTPGLETKHAVALASIERNVLRLALLVKDLLTASHLTSGHFELVPFAIHLNQVVADAVTSFQAQARELGVALDASGDAPVPAFADPDRIMQVMFNLLGNALKFTPQGGTVHVEVSSRQGRAQVTVMDTGIGFDESSRKDLFRPFGRLHEDVPGTPKGTGLGLFLSKGIVEESGGEIWAESAGVGKGTLVGFSLPLQDPRPGRGIRLASPAKDSPSAPPSQGVSPSPEPAAAHQTGRMRSK